LKEERKMSEQNKAIVRRSFEEVWTNKNLDVLGEFVTADAVDHTRSRDGNLQRRTRRQQQTLAREKLP
jgi:hypothetical protein